MLVAVALTMIVLLGFAGLAIDAGLWYRDRVKLQTAAEFAALAADFELMDSSPSVAVVEAAALSSAAENGAYAMIAATIGTAVYALTGGGGGG